jgi:hypothetical protein
MASISQPGVVDKQAEDTVDNPPPPLGNEGQSAGGSMNKVTSTCSMNRSVSDMKKRTSTFTMKKADEESRMSGDEKDRAARRLETIKPGMRFYHDKHGPGTVDNVLDDGVVVIHFDNGDFHRYRPGNMHKLTPILDEAHEFTPDTLFAMMDKDHSGHIDLD